IKGRAFAASIADLDRFAVAQAFVHTMVATWWRGLTAQAREPIPLRQPFQSLDSVRLPASAESLAHRLGGEAAALETNLAAYQIGLVYGSLLPQEHHARLGVI